MARALAIAAPYRDASLEALRLVIVYGSALALIAAGQGLPHLPF